MLERTTCPLDCYDVCQMVPMDGKLKGVSDGLTQGFLCPHLNHYNRFSRITEPLYKGAPVSISKALEILKEMIQKSQKLLHYRGSGNFALMQEVTDHFFASYGATLTDGSLCDGAGGAGVIDGRGQNEIFSPQEIAKAEVVVFWGRNPHTTSSHLLPLVRGKEIIVVDPVRTKIAESADLFLQIRPHEDMRLALLLSRFLCIEGNIDVAYLQRHAPDYEEFYELTQTVRIKSAIEHIGVSLGDIGTFLHMVGHKRVMVVCGIGIQKYLDGADVMRAIDAFGVLLGLFGKEGCGVAYMGASRQGVEIPFCSDTKRVSKVDTPFGNFDTVFIQGANPLNQMPDTLRVESEIAKVENLIYFGLYENETSKAADLVIPAKNFLEKEDIRTSYATNYMYEMPKLKESDIGISEYALSAFLCQSFNIKLKSEQEYLQHFRSCAVLNEEGVLQKKRMAQQAYEKGFYTGDGKFLFLEEVDIEEDQEEGFFLITCKSAKSLNSQFKRESAVFIHPELGYAQGETVQISSKSGTIVLPVMHDARLRKDCVLIYSGTHGVNKLTSSQKSYEGNSAVLQHNKVVLTSL